MSSKDELAGLYLQEKYDVDGDPEGVSGNIGTHVSLLYSCVAHIKSPVRGRRGGVWSCVGGGGGDARNIVAATSTI